ncbi:site-specific DNA-methyltransferase [Pseudoxanthomonas kaohsiungensis]|uniref:site-specific DNA-methyltransferase (adenine-specific) n=1 Tax=Pseudoxanthomonas kaohsiungensis TaxID=283923 RepID=A0ABW3LXI2_9GAMM|nr:site-specific DNA-methyltransferase [Pseudoxanthomonas kaohsiungensis]KAF1704759.1 site-specific DNA-methyltransferase [Pseudoxanthomonas kaohsiungensis]
MDKLKMHSPDLTAANIARIRDLFPGCVTEARGEDGEVKLAVDFDLLRQELSASLVEGPQERYHLDWPGKREALLTANAPIAKTLRPSRDESVDFDTTKNLFIEGDNLDALKLLQETYLGKVKMIYIDPPYNTGNDFIYEDNFAENADEYLRRSNQVDAEGNRMVANTAANGRLHSDWLSMMYSRLRLARNLLADDGVFLASIDDSEASTLKQILDEVFGEQNFIDTITVEMSTTSGPKTVNAQQGTIVKNAEFIHIYRKSEEFDKKPHRPLLDGIDSFDTHYSIWLHEDGSLGSLADVMLSNEAVGAEIRRFDLIERNRFSIKSIDKLIAVSDKAKSFIESNLERIARIDRPPISASGRSTRVGHYETFEADRRTYLLTTLENGALQALMPLSLNYRMSDDYKPRFGRTVIRGDLWKGFHQDMGNVAKEGEIAFSNGKKPVRLIKQLILWANNSENGTIVDFFAGSGTTAHAVMQANAEDGANRRFVVVQIGEKPEPKSDAAKAGFATIADVSKERIRRAGKKIAANLANGSVDTGFRVLKVETSNMADVFYSPDATTQDDLLAAIDNIKPDRTPEDLLFQVMLDWGVDLALPIEKKTIAGKEVFFVDTDALAACFDADGGIDDAFIMALAKTKPLRAVFRDAGFKNDAAKINAEQIFKQLSPGTDVKTL